MFMLGIKVTFQQRSPKSVQFHRLLFSYLTIAAIHRHYSLGNSFSLPLLPTPVFLDFPGGSAGKESACNVGDLGSIPGLGRSPGEGNGNPLQCSCLGNPMDREAWWATVHGVTKELDAT